MPYRFPKVADQVQATVAQAIDVPSFRALLLRLLARPGRVLDSTGTGKWPAFVLETCRALGGSPADAVGAAAAVELAIAAADVVDDLADDEWDEQDGTPARAINASLALSFLSQRCAGGLAEAIGTERAARIGRLLAQGIVAACIGEDMDLSFEAAAEVTEDQAHEMTRRKSGSLVAMACRVGAAVAVDDPCVIEAAGRFGSHVGVVAQLLNDLAGVDPDPARRGSDLRRRKKTLPVAYTLRCAREEGLTAMVRWSQSTTSLPDVADDELAKSIRDAGGLHYTWVVADMHRAEALAVLRELTALTGRAEIRRLRQLIPTVRARWCRA